MQRCGLLCRSRNTCVALRRQSSHAIPILCASSQTQITRHTEGGWAKLVGSGAARHCGMIRLLC
jgi:hypothetical protein